MRRACDWLVDRYLIAPVEPVVRAALRLGAYQLVFVEVPAHAAVNTTVSASPARARRLVNAVLRKISAETDRTWPDDATRLSYPEWIVERLRTDLGTVDADDALAAMNVGAPSTVRADGYVQDESSQLVGAAVGAVDGERVADICAAPGGKATAMAASGALVVASDLRASRVSLIAANRDKLDAQFARRGGCRRHSLAVCATRRSIGCSSTRRARGSARCGTAPTRGGVSTKPRPNGWRRCSSPCWPKPSASSKPGGVVLYSVCTLTDAETVAVDARVERELPGLVPMALGEPWQPRGRGGQILPQLRDTDGMFAVRYEKH